MDKIIDQAKNEAGDTPDWLPNDYEYVEPAFSKSSTTEAPVTIGTIGFIEGVHRGEDSSSFIPTLNFIILILYFL